THSTGGRHLTHSTAVRRLSYPAEVGHGTKLSRTGLHCPSSPCRRLRRTLRPSAWRLRACAPTATRPCILPWPLAVSIDLIKSAVYRALRRNRRYTVRKLHRRPASGALLP